LPFEDYINAFKPIADKYGLKVIMLITPETSDERIRLIDEHTGGFIYMVSSAATTGEQQTFDEQKQAYFHRINALSLRNPCMVGFGVSNPETFRAACEHSSGAIIGSRFVSLLDKTRSPQAAITELKKILFT
jgi:tryptophan synthase alpha chain